MKNQFRAAAVRWLLRSFVVIAVYVAVYVAVYSVQISAQTSSGKCRPAVIPVENEPPPKILVDAPLADPLVRGVAVIQYCTENVHLVPVFGPKAVQVTPRVGHLHVRVDDASWVWAEASGNPIIILGLAPGLHKVSLELMNANHQPLDKAEVTFTMPKSRAPDIQPVKAQGHGASSEKLRSSSHPDQSADMSHHP